MWNLFQSLLSPDTYMPHGSCYLWQTPLVALHAISDGLVAIAYFSIPALLAYFLWQRRDLPARFSRIFILFSAFIILCGLGHALDVWTLWHPAYWLAGVERAATALVSCYTAAEMVVLLPRFLSLKTPEQLAAVNRELEREVAERRKAEEALQNIVSGTAAVTGEAFFPMLAQHLAQGLEVDYVLISEMVEAGSDARLQPLAFWASDALAMPTSVPLTGTPCEQAIGEGGVCYSEQVCAQFPEAAWLAELQVSSYLGVPLLEEDGKAIGSLCILHRQVLAADARTRDIVQVFAARAAAELQRQRAAAALACVNEELEARVQARTAELLAANATLTREIQTRTAAEQALKANQLFLDRLLNAVSDPIFVKDRQHRWIALNDAFCRLMN